MGALDPWVPGGGRERGLGIKGPPKQESQSRPGGGMLRILNEEGPGYLDPWVLGEKTQVGALGSGPLGLQEGGGGGRTPGFPEKGADWDPGSLGLG